MAKYALANCVILDGTAEMEPKTGLAVLVDGERIADIVSAESVPAEYEKVDLGGRYLLPGLVNLHVHIPGSGKPKKKPTDTKKLVKLLTSNSLTRKIIEAMYLKYAQTELFSGVTTIRSVGGVESYDTLTRDRINSGKAVGPRILAGNMAVSVPGGHMAGSLAYEATTPEEAAGFVEKIAADKPDLIKLMITGGVLDAEQRGEPGIVRMKPELVKAACDKAHELGLPVAAHVESTDGVRIALENGVNTIEHGAKPNEKVLSLFKEKKAALVATLSPALPYALFDLSISNCGEMAQYNGRVVFDGIIECAKQCMEKDVPVGLGTDTGCPFITHYDMWRELNYFTKYCGVSRKFALHTATELNARIAGIDGETGTIARGKSADMIVTDADPLTDAQALRNIGEVIIRGRRIVSPKVKKMAKCEKELDKFL